MRVLLIAIFIVLGLACAYFAYDGFMADERAERAWAEQAMEWCGGFGLSLEHASAQNEEIICVKR